MSAALDSICVSAQEICLFVPHFFFLMAWPSSSSILSQMSFYGWIVFHCAYIPHFLYLFIFCWTLGWTVYLHYYEGCYVKRWNIDISWQIEFISYGYIPSNEITRLYRISILVFLRNFCILHAIFKSSPFSITSPYLLFSSFLVTAVLTWLRLYLIMVLSCILMMTMDVCYLIYSHLLFVSLLLQNVCPNFLPACFNWIVSYFCFYWDGWVPRVF